MKYLQLYAPLRAIGLSLCCVFLFSAKETGCRRTSAPGAAGMVTEAKSVEFLRKKLRSHEHPNLKYANAQAKIYVEGNGQSIGANANVIWIRDSVMWINIKKFGLEAARVLVTRDSVFTLNRLEKTYSARGLESIQHQYNLPAGFELVQSLLLASPWFDPEIKLESDLKDGQYRLSGTNGRFAADYRVGAEPYPLKQEIFLQPRDARTVSVVFENFKKTQEAGWFPYLRTVEAYSPDSGQLHLSIELNDVEFNVPKNYKFEIPGHYQRVE